jgi:hypothetical protein
LNRRGQWLLPEGLITNLRLIEYIGDRYHYDPGTKCMVVENGPQKIFVTLEYTPWIYRITPGRKGERIFTTHTGKAVLDLKEAFVDEAGNLLLLSEWGIGVFADTDLALLIPWLSEKEESFLLSLPSGKELTLRQIHSQELPWRFHYQPSPEPLPFAGAYGHREDRNTL